MKNIDKMSRLTGELEKLFRLLNADFFDNQLPMPIITAIPTAKAFAHYTPYDAWSLKNNGGKREINISTAFLDRPLENIVASMVHEMVHYYNDVVLNEQDCSRGGTYHNGIFKREAERHGLIVSRSEKYGWTITEPSEELFFWTAEHSELREIELCRSIPFPVSTGGHANNGSSSPTTGTTNPNSHSRKYVCPCCRSSVRATKAVNIICADCMEPMQAV